MIVADTNLIVYLLVSGQWTGQAEAVYKKDSEWVAPTLWRSEFRNFLAFSMRRKLMGLEEALDYVGQAERLVAAQEYLVSSTRVLQLAAESGCSAYDCEFVALAEGLGVPLVTTDEALLGKFKPLALSMKDFCS